MAQSLTGAVFVMHLRRYGVLCAWLCCLLSAMLISPPVLAEIFADPTRPSASLNQASASSALVIAAPVLQSVVISSQRALATINGQTVRLGEKLGSATVIRITENEVALRNGREVQILRLFPVIERRQVMERNNARPEGTVR